MTCGREVLPTYNAIQQGRGGCRFCGPSGLDYTAPGLIYLIEEFALQAVKIGVTTAAARTDRLAQHTQNGWRVVETWNVSTGEDAINVERSILRWWRDDLGAPVALTRAEMPQGGWTETASLQWIDLDETIDRIQAEVVTRSLG